MNQAIADTMKSKGWQEIVQVFEAEINDNLRSIETKQAKENIAVEYIGRKEAENIVRNVFKKLDKMSHETEVIQVKYK